MNFKEILRKYLNINLSDTQIRYIRNKIGDLKSSFYNRNLNLIGKYYGTDKVTVHNYTPIYMTHFRKLRNRKVKLLEIGIGGYNNPTKGGRSLKMWKSYFRKGMIYGIDIFDKSQIQENRIIVFKGDQTDIDLLNRITIETGKLDIIIDDGSHINNHVIKTFTILFQKLKKGGIYVIEDTQTSYMEDFGGDATTLSNPKTTMNFFKQLTDLVNRKEFSNFGKFDEYLDFHINSIHFYPNIIFIHKD